MPRLNYLEREFSKLLRFHLHMQGHPFLGDLDMWSLGVFTGGRGPLSCTKASIMPMPATSYSAHACLTACALSVLCPHRYLACLEERAQQVPDVFLDAVMPFILFRGGNVQAGTDERGLWDRLDVPLPLCRHSHGFRCQRRQEGVLGSRRFCRLAGHMSRLDPCYFI